MHEALRSKNYDLLCQFLLINPLRLLNPLKPLLSKLCLQRSINLIKTCYVLKPRL